MGDSCILKISIMNKTHTREKKKNIFSLTSDLAVRVLFFLFSIIWHYKTSLCHIWFINFTVFLCFSPTISHPIICIFYIVFLSCIILYSLRTTIKNLNLNLNLSMIQKKECFLIIYILSNHC